MELLAPAGTMECLKAAVRGGADAVYFAGRQFGARSYAGNFSDDEIREATKYCRIHGVKSYVTVNTMVTDREFRELDDHIELLADAGADGVIVQDLGVLRRIREICPDMPIHASTQMTIHNLDGVRQMEQVGVKRVVLARELSKEEIRHIADSCTAELEVFVHGAMCMSYSGQCLMSSVLGGRSGNRGRCAQPCRLVYRGEAGNDGSYLSLKDMSLLAHLKELQEIGAASLKIEGRMKGAEYVGTVTEIYRRCIDAMRLPTEQEQDRLNRVFFRGGLTDGYFIDKIGSEMFAFDRPENPYERQKDHIAEQKEEPAVTVSCAAYFAAGKPPRLTLTGCDTSVTVMGEEPLSTAQKRGADEDELRNRLSKTGGTAFRFSPVRITVEGTPFAAVSTVNALRRKGIAALEEAIAAKGRKKIQRTKSEKTETIQPAEYHLAATVRTMEQYAAIREFPFVYMELPLSVVYENRERLTAEQDRIVIAPPVILRDKEKEQIEEKLNCLAEMGFSRMRCETVNDIPRKDRFRLYGGHRMNLANSSALLEVRDLGLETACVSAELNFAQVRDLQKPIPLEQLIYGHLPLMITENCVLKNCGDCPCDGGGRLYDRKGKSFPVVRDGDACRSVILNGVPLYLADKQEEVRDSGIAVGRLLFTIETAEQCAKICRAYFTEDSDLPSEFTRLHYHKGVL